MVNSLVNRLIIFFARKLHVAPGVAHVLLLFLVSIGYGAINPDGFHAFTAPFFTLIWVGLCSFVVLATWLTKGDYRKIWWRAEPWRQ